jgi:hypothetical protein
MLQTRLGDKDVALAFEKDDLTALFSTLSLFPQYVEQVLSFEKAHDADPNNTEALAIRRGTVQFLSANLGKTLGRVLTQLGEDAKMRAWIAAGPDTAALAEYYRNKNKIEVPPESRLHSE